MYSARNRNAMITDDTFQIQDWLRSNGTNHHDRGIFPEFEYHHRIRPLSPVKGHRRVSSAATAASDGRGPDRRRQLKSMESLLGLSDENINGKHNILNTEVVTRASPDVQDSLDRALMDFEETLELAFQSNSIVPPPRGFSNNNLLEGDESNFNKLDSSFESNTTGSSGYSTKPDHSVHRSVNTYNELQIIREQMMKSLEIIKDLEEQVKLVPLLKVQVSSLNMEKQRLSSELDEYKRMDSINKNTTVGSDRCPSETLTDDRHRWTVSTREIGVNCVPICRDVGVITPTTPAVAVTKSACASTMTDERAPVEPVTVTVTASTQTAVDIKPVAVTAYTQTDAASTDTVAVPSVVTTATLVDVGTQSMRPATVRTFAVGMMAKPRTYDVSVAAKPSFKHVGCTVDMTDATKAVMVNPAAIVTPPPVTRTTQTDIATTPVLQARVTQTDVVSTPVLQARNTQTDVVSTPLLRARTTQTDAAGGGGDDEQHHGIVQTADAVRGNAQSDSSGRLVATIGRRSNSFHHYTVATPVKEPPTTPPAAVTSKIPRLKQPVTPELNRKVLNRQDTYTKTAAEIGCRDQPSPSSPSPPPQPHVADVDCSFDDVKTIEQSTPKHQNGHAEIDSINFKPIQDDVYKDNPSKEMRGALKVLNDSLKKTSATLLPRTQLKQAIDIVREEWFKVSSSSSCGGHLVKNYINWFTSYSPVLLEFIINMTDAAGNTVLHYAISHGNFDVVSTIMDTGVCNVNLTNDAGYSSVMLVSLAEIKNNEEMKIIKRLFKLGDVNLQAKKHGQTTLMLAVSHGKTEIVKLLLECGADLNIQDEDGSTALMCAAEHGLQEIVNILLSCPECDVSIADNDGSTALSIAMEAGHREIGIALYAKQHIISRDNSPFNLSKTKRSRSANNVMPSNMSHSHLSLKKSSSLQPKEYATLSSMLKTRIP